MITFPLMSALVSEKPDNYCFQSQPSFSYHISKVDVYFVWILIVGFIHWKQKQLIVQVTSPQRHVH